MMSSKKAFRKWYNFRITTLCILMVLAVLGAGNLCIAGPQDNLNYAGAKKEGKLVYYTATGTKDATDLITAFEKIYPGVKVELFRTGSQRLMTRIFNEFRAQKYLFDVVNVNIQAMNSFKESNILGKYFSPERKAYPEAFQDPEGYWTGIYSSIYVIAYNTKMVSAQEAPKTLEDLMQPKWKGKIMMDTQVVQWLAFMIQQFGREKALTMCRRIAANDPTFRRGSTLIVQLLAAGEVPIAFPMKGHSVEAAKLLGAPIQWTRPEPVFFSQSGMGISSHPKNPNAGKLFVDFVLSEHGQTTIAKMSRTTTRPGVKQFAPELTDGIHYLKQKILSVEEYSEMNKLFRQIFMIK